jgi:hypothetical protein
MVSDQDGYLVMRVFVVKCDRGLRMCVGCLSRHHWASLAIVAVCAVQLKLGKATVKAMSNNLR